MTTHPELRKVLVVGGGIGGMATAILLRRKGADVDLVDIDPNWRALGAGLTVNFYSLRAFQHVGILPEILTQAHIHDGVRIFGDDGSVVVEVPGREVGADMTPMTMGGILRPVLHEILAAKVRASGVRVRLGVTVDSLTSVDGGVDVVASDGEAGRYDLVIGSDGVNSKVRSLVWPDLPPPEFTGQGCWRALFKRPAEVVTNWLYQGVRIKAGFNPVSRDEMYGYVVETADPDMWVSDEEKVAMMKERMLQFTGLVRQLGETLNEDSSVNYRPLHSILLPPPWNVGRVLLIGDAVHAPLPHSAYGAGLAVEDAVVLDDELASNDPLDVVLTRFANRRWKRCSAVVESSRRVGRMEMEGMPQEEMMKSLARLGTRDILAEPL